MRSERNLMPQRIPIKAAREVAKDYSCRQVIVLAWDGELTHIVTYGESTEDCAQAAAGGNMLKQKWGWPECNDQPSRVKKLEKELAAEREARERAEKALREALIPLAILVTSGACVDAPTELCEELKQAVLKGHDAALGALTSLKSSEGAK